VKSYPDFQLIFTPKRTLFKLKIPFDEQFDEHMPILAFFTGIRQNF